MKFLLVITVFVLGSQTALASKAKHPFVRLISIKNILKGRNQQAPAQLPVLTIAPPSKPQKDSGITKKFEQHLLQFRNYESAINLEAVVSFYEKYSEQIEMRHLWKNANGNALGFLLENAKDEDLLTVADIELRDRNYSYIDRWKSQNIKVLVNSPQTTKIPTSFEQDFYSAWVSCKSNIDALDFLKYLVRRLKGKQPILLEPRQIRSLFLYALNMNSCSLSDLAKIGFVLRDHLPTWMDDLVDPEQSYSSEGWRALIQASETIPIEGTPQLGLQLLTKLSQSRLTNKKWNYAYAILNSSAFKWNQESYSQALLENSKDFNINEFLRKFPVNPEIKISNRTLLVWSTLNGDEETMKHLLDQGHHLGLDEATEIAWENKNFGILRSLLEKNLLSLHGQDPKQLREFYIDTVQNGSRKHVKWILNHAGPFDINLDARDTQFLRSAVHCAVIKENADTVRYLIKRGANINLPAETGKRKSARDDLMKSKNPEMRKIARELNAKEAETSLSSLNLEDSKEVQKFLFKVVFSGKKELIQKTVDLIREKFQLDNLRDENQSTALAFAVRENLPQAISILVKAGASTQISVKDSETPVSALYIAQEIGNHEVVDALLTIEEEQAFLSSKKAR